MIFSLLRKVLYNRYILIATTTISAITCSPLIANASPITIFTNGQEFSSTTFDFKGCFNQGSNIVCGGFLRSTSGDQAATILRDMGGQSNTKIIDSNGGIHTANKISVGTSYKCDMSCPYMDNITLVEGVNYKTLVVFENVSLSSISLFEISGLNFKSRNINVQNNSPQGNTQSQTSNTSPTEIRKPIALKLTQSKKISDNKGFKLVPITRAVEGDVIVYNIAVNNVSNRPVNNLVLNQKIHRGANYVLNSATSIAGADLVFSIDGGKSYSTRPMIDDEPAPANRYTHVRWIFNGSIAPKSQSYVSYEIRVNS